MSEQFEFKEQNTSHIYRTELPNIVFYLNLKPIEFNVYAAIKKCAGDFGKCTMSSTNLAKLCNCTKKTLIKAIKSICQINKVIGFPLISLTERPHEHGDNDTNLIIINDIWPINFNLQGGSVKITPPSVKITPGVVENLHQGSVKITPKEEPFKKNHIKKQQQAPKKLSSDQDSLAAAAAAFKEKADYLIEEKNKNNIPVDDAAIHRLVKKGKEREVISVLKRLAKEKHAPGKNKTAIFVSAVNEEVL